MNSTSHAVPAPARSDPRSARARGRRWRWAGERAWGAVARGVLAVGGRPAAAGGGLRPVPRIVAGGRPPRVHRHYNLVGVVLPNGVILLFALLSLVLLVGVRAL